MVALRLAYRHRRAHRLLALHLPDTTPLAELVRLVKIRWRIERDYRELKTGLGLDHFEGRSRLGWHHNATLVTAAHLFLTTLRLADQKRLGGTDPVWNRTRNSTRTCPLDRQLPLCHHTFLA
ncbi:transposase [Rhodococcus opacus]|uniref:transposase n=1 Tax=Rhodococcus opacus TaxID=37919 RepID=UPI002952F8A2|nr:transposase [Rhodococcus opacus]MDV7088438.1 transposase [Rhodococcus opacus]